MLVLPHELPTEAERRQARLYRESRIRHAGKQAQREETQQAARAGRRPGGIQLAVREASEAARFEQRWLGQVLGPVADDWAMLWMSEHRGVDGMARRRGPRAELLAPGSQLRHLTFATPELAVAAVHAATRRAAASLPGLALGDPVVSLGVWAALAELVPGEALSVARALHGAAPELSVAQLLGNACAIVQ